MRVCTPLEGDHYRLDMSGRSNDFLLLYLGQAFARFVLFQFVICFLLFTEFKKLKVHTIF